jgi:hypothetical protein
MRSSGAGRLTLVDCFGGTGDSINLTASWAETETSSSVGLICRFRMLKVLDLELEKVRGRLSLCVVSEASDRRF